MSGETKTKKMGRVGDGTPGPGRPKGSIQPYKKVQNILKELDLNPTKEILKLMNELSPKDQVAAWAMLLKYCEPVATEIVQSNGEVVEVVFKTLPEVKE